MTFKLCFIVFLIEEKHYFHIGFLDATALYINKLVLKGNSRLLLEKTNVNEI